MSALYPSDRQFVSVTATGSLCRCGSKTVRYYLKWIRGSRVRCDRGHFARSPYQMLDFR